MPSKIGGGAGAQWAESGTAPRLVRRLVQYFNRDRVRSGNRSHHRRNLCAAPPHTRFLAIEISSRFADTLRTRFPGLCVCVGSVGEVKTHCEAQGVEQVDAIVSGLPWAVFSDENQTTYLDATMQVLRPGGQFITFGYLQGLVLPSAHRFRKKLQGYFSEVRTSKPVWANLPPAFFYCCRR